MTSKLNLITITILVIVMFSLPTYAQTAPPQPTAYNQKLQSPFLLFMENRGQVADAKGNVRPDVLFTANSAGVKLYLSANAIHYQFTKTEYPKGYDPHKRELAKDLAKEAELQKQIKTSTHRFSLELQDANLHPAVTTEKQSAYTENYYLAHCPDGITGVHGYEKITYKNVYPKIDWVIYSKGGFMEYDFLVHPGGKPTDIKLRVKDAESVSITATGELLIKTSLGEVREKAPVSYADGAIVETHFKQLGDGMIEFDIDTQPGKELRIDPYVIWSTYYGGGGSENAIATSVDKNRNVYLAGYTNSTVGFALGGHQNIFGGSIDGFIVKFDSAGSRLWATYYGGTGTDLLRSCAVDGNGDVYFSGQTNSSSGIASGGSQNTIAGYDDGFVVKLNSSGTRLWATYFGGSSYEYGFTCCTDKNNNVYFCGETTSSTGISFNGHQNSFGGSGDNFLVKFNTNGTKLWATYYGGSGDEEYGACTVDNGGHVFLAGATKSANNISFNGHQNTRAGDWDSYLVKFDSSGVRQWATYYGSPGIDEGQACIADTLGNVYLIGFTDSTTGIAFNGHQNNFAGRFDAFLVKFNSAGARLWGTYYGGNKDEFGNAGCVDNQGNVYLTGETSSNNGVASNGIQNFYGGGYNDAFLVKFNSVGTRQWGTYYGGTDQDAAFGCTNDGAVVYIAGYTRSGRGIALNGFQGSIAGASDAILTKINTGPTINVCSNSLVILTSNITGASYQWETSINAITWVNVSDSSASTQTLQLPNLPSSFYGNYYRCRLNSITYSDVYQIKFQNTWTGSVNSVWENPANWSCGILPDGNTDVIINSGPVTLNSNGICRTLTVRPGVSFTVAAGNMLTITH